MNRASQVEPEWFTDRAEESGLTFRHVNGTEGKFYYAEVIAPGAGLVDYDNDGDLDVFLVQGGSLSASGIRDSGLGIREPKSRLFRNDLALNADGTRTLRFTDVTEASGIVSNGYGMGVTTGDFNNDGCVDLYMTSLGPNQLFRNNCNGTFTDVSKHSRTDDPSWTVSSAFLDFDRELLAPRYRACEQAMALLARAARLVGPRARGGRILVQTFLPQHPVLQAAVRADPGRLADHERGQRKLLGLPPFGAYAEIEGKGSAEFVASLPTGEGVVVAQVGESYVARADDWMTLGEVLGQGERKPGSRLRVAVDPPR